jgi:hypothetical protein
MAISHHSPSQILPRLTALVDLGQSVPELPHTMYMNVHCDATASSKGPSSSASAVEASLRDVRVQRMAAAGIPVRLMQRCGWWVALGLHGSEDSMPMPAVTKASEPAWVHWALAAPTLCEASLRTHFASWQQMEAAAQPEATPATGCCSARLLPTSLGMAHALGTLRHAPAQCTTRCAACGRFESWITTCLTNLHHSLQHWRKDGMMSFACEP